MHNLKSAILILSLLAGASAAGAQTVRHSMVPRDRFLLQDVGEVQVSPDGTRVAFTVVTSDVATNEVKTRLMIQPLPDGQPTDVPVPDSPANLRWSPDGSRLAFIASKDNRAAIWTLEPATGAVHQVSDYDRGNSFLSEATSWLAWSPDGHYLAIGFHRLRSNVLANTIF